MDKITEHFEERISNNFQVVYESKEVFNNEDFNYKILIVLEDLREISGDDEEGIIVTVNAVKTPEEIGRKKVSDFIGDEKITVYDIWNYGMYAILEHGEEKCKTLQQAEQQAEKFAQKLNIYNSMFGFYMDKPMNAIGTTGWELINGELITFNNKL